MMSEPVSKPKIKYAQPPIQEAICEVHFKLPAPLDKGDIEHIKPIWEGGYPTQQMVTEQNLEVRLSMDKVDTKSTATGHKLIARSADGKNLAQLGPKFIAVNRLNPYLGWEESFRGTIWSRLSEAQSVFNFQEIERIGLRYINKIELPEQPARWAEWFAVPLPVAGSLGECGGVFQFHFEQALSANLQTYINFLNLPTPPSASTTIILDIDVIWRGSEAVAGAKHLLEAVHDPHRDLFEGYLLDKTRALFKV
jgi:uncharacterized protein (TIGR04255 family)